MKTRTPPISYDTATRETLWNASTQHFAIAG